MGATWPQIKGILDGSGLVKRRSESLYELDIPIRDMAPTGGSVATGRWQNVFVEHVASAELVRVFSFISFVTESLGMASGLPGPFTAEADALRIMEALSKLGFANIAYMNGDVWGQHTDKSVLMCLALANSFPLRILDASNESDFGGYLMLIAHEADRIEQVLAGQYGKKDILDEF